MYLAALIADEKQMSKKDLQKWVKMAKWYYLTEYAVAWISAESEFGEELALEWIKSPEEGIASAGWSTLSNWIAMKPDEELDIEFYNSLMDKVKSEIHQAKNRVRYTMNVFVISVGCYIESLTEKAIKTAEIIGRVNVYMGETSCKVPEAVTYIEKVKGMGQLPHVWYRLFLFARYRIFPIRSLLHLLSFQQLWVFPFKLI